MSPGSQTPAAGVGHPLQARRTFLVTGAAGGLGAEVCARLTARGQPVIGLLHQARAVVRNDGKTLPCLPFAGRPEPGTMATLTADVCRPGLGLPDDVRAALRAATDTVIHCAATTEFGRPVAQYQAVNVGGTVGILEFAQDGPGEAIPLVHVSTAFVCGSRTGPIKESELDAGQSFGNAYEASKFTAEARIREESARGHPVAIVRPSIVVGAGRTGVIRDFTNMYVMIRAVTRGLAMTLPADYDALLDLVPIDYVAESIATVAVDFGRAVGETLHVVGRKPLTLLDVSEVLAEVPSFYVPRFVPPSCFDAARLPANEQRYYTTIIKLYEKYLRCRPLFHAATAHRIVGADPSPGGRRFLRQLIRYCMRVGYLGVAPHAIRSELTD